MARRGEIDIMENLGSERFNGTREHARAGYSGGSALTASYVPCEREFQ